MVIAWEGNINRSVNSTVSSIDSDIFTGDEAGKEEQYIGIGQGEDEDEDDEEEEEAQRCQESTKLGASNNVKAR